MCSSGKNLLSIVVNALNSLLALLPRGESMGSEKRKKRTDLAKHKKGGYKRPRSDAPVLPAAVSTTLPSRMAVQGMSPDAQDTFVTGVGKFREKKLRLIDVGTAALSTQRQLDDKVGGLSTVTRLEDTVLADMARLRNAPVAREFVDLTAWRRLRSASDKARAGIDAACSNDGRPGDEVELDENSKDSLRHDSALSFKQMHLQTMTGQFADDLANLHEVEQMDGKRVQNLLRCLEEGANLFAGVFPSEYCNAHVDMASKAWFGRSRIELV